MNDDYKFMMMAIELAKKGLGHVSPNPMVGALLVENQQVISQGYHQKFGHAHAEKECLDSISPSSDATLYVTLEPCCHTKKKTPPCLDLILEKKIKRVVIAMEDPNPLVRGKSIEKLRAHGVKVIVGVGQKEAMALNEKFIHFMTQNKPFITLKMATTLDGKIAMNDGSSKWITSKAARNFAHELRKAHDAILVGGETLRKDNPQLTIRTDEFQKTPYRIILTKSGKLENHLQVLTCEPEKTILVSDRRLPYPEVSQLTLSTLDPFPFAEFYQKLANFPISSILVEGGAQMHQLFLENKEFQELIMIYSPSLMGEGKSVLKKPLIKNINELSPFQDFAISAHPDFFVVTARNQ